MNENNNPIDAITGEIEINLNLFTITILAKAPRLEIETFDDGGKWGGRIVSVIHKRMKDDCKTVREPVLEWKAIFDSAKNAEAWMQLIIDKAKKEFEHRFEKAEGHDE